MRVPIRIVIAEDQRLVRELMATLLGRESDMAIVGEASTGPEALRAVHASLPDVLLLDIGLPELDGVEVARTLRKESAPSRIIALSVHTERRFVQEMLQIGVEGYIVKSAAVKELVQAIRTVMEGRVYLSPEIAHEALERMGPVSLSRMARLGRRERQVLALLADGKRSTEIASTLAISVATVEVHRRNIMRKLDLHTVAELTKYAIREGLTSL
jgi:two-component system NarL family response regulator